jgi:hypothetical protein
MNNRQSTACAALLVGALAWSLATPSLASPLLKFKPPSRGTPPITGGAASRSGGACILGQEPLKALMPRSNYGLTAVADPVLLVYVPQSTAKTVEFQLRTADNRSRVFRKSMPTPTTAGIVRLSVDNAGLSPLQSNQSYRWYVSLVCNVGDRSLNPIVEGWVERIPADAALTQKLTQATDQSRPFVYAEAGLWYEAVASLDALRRSQPTHPGLRTQWTSLLQSVGLDAYITASPVDVGPTPSSAPPPMPRDR